MVSITEEQDSDRTDIYTPRSILKDSETETEYQIRTRFFMNPQTAKLPTRVYRHAIKRQFSEPRFRLSQLRQMEQSNLLKCKGEDVGTQFYLEDAKSESAVHERRRGSLDSGAFLGVSEPNTTGVLEGRLLADLQSAIGHYTMLSVSLSELDNTEFNVRLQCPSASGETQTWTSGDAFRPATSDGSELTKLIKAKKPLRTNRRQPISPRKRASSEYGQISMIRLNTNPSSHQPRKPNVPGSCAQPKPDRSWKTCNYQRGRSPLFNLEPFETGARTQQKISKRSETQQVSPLRRKTKEERVIRKLHPSSANHLLEHSFKETNRLAKPIRANLRKNSDSARKTVLSKVSKPHSASKVARNTGQQRRSKSSAT